MLGYILKCLDIHKNLLLYMLNFKDKVYVEELELFLHKINRRLPGLEKEIQIESFYKAANNYPFFKVDNEVIHRIDGYFTKEFIETAMKIIILPEIRRVAFDTFYS